MIPVHLVQPGRVGHGVRNPAHQIFAIGDLWIHDGFGSENLACAKVAQMTGHRCAADVNGQTINTFFITRLDVDHFAVVP